MVVALSTATALPSLLIDRRIRFDRRTPAQRKHTNSWGGMASSSPFVLPRRYALGLVLVVPLAAAAGYHNRAAMPHGYKLPFCWDFSGGWGYKKEGAACPLTGAKAEDTQ